MLDPSLFTELKASGNLPSPKGSALRVMELCQREDMTLPELIHALQVDPTMVGRILKLANSAVFGRIRPVAALTPDVLMSIGVHSVSQIVLAFSLVSDHRHGRCSAFDYENFWSRSLATAVAFQLIGTETRAGAAAELFTVGLLANVGLLAMASIHPDAYARLLEEAGGQNSITLAGLEKHAFGYDHREVAEAMMRDFGLPQMFTDAALSHEAHGRLSQHPESRAQRMVHGLHLAARLAGLCFVENANRMAAYREVLPLAHVLGIPAARLAQIGDEMLREWAEWGRLLKVPVQDMPPFEAIERSAPAPQMLPALVLAQDPALGPELRRLLGEAGYGARLARNPHDALLQFLDAQPALVIADLQADQANGLDFIRTVRQTELGKAAYILVLKAPTEVGLLERALDAGADDALDTPIVGAMLAVRLRAGARLVAEHQRLREEQEQLQRRLLELSIVSQHARQAALTDALTGIYNRRYAMDRLAQEWAEAQRGHRPLAVLMVDIDFFKAINDTNGHDVGDAALCHVADLLRETVRLSDTVCRYGGEEFVVIAPDTAIEGALRLGERLRAAIEHRPLLVAGREVSLTASVGVAERGDTIGNLQRLLKAADDALYGAKRKGRNRVEWIP